MKGLGKVGRRGVGGGAAAVRHGEGGPLRFCVCGGRWLVGEGGLAGS